MKYLLLFLLWLVSRQVAGQPIPALKMDDVLKIIDTSNGPIVVNFWATWCVPCVEEIPVFEKVVSKAGTPVRLILVSLDLKSEYPAALNTFIKKHKFNSPVIWLNETDADHFCPMIDQDWEGSIPATLFIHRAKKYRNFVSVQLPAALFKQQLDKML